MMCAAGAPDAPLRDHTSTSTRYFARNRLFWFALYVAEIRIVTYPDVFALNVPLTHPLTTYAAAAAAVRGVGNDGGSIVVIVVVDAVVVLVVNVFVVIAVVVVAVHVVVPI